jgi:hypothetical protein
VSRFRRFISFKVIIWFYGAVNGRSVQERSHLVQSIFSSQPRILPRLSRPASMKMDTQRVIAILQDKRTE